MRISVNGKQQIVEEGTTVRELLNRMRVDSRKVAVEVNLEIVAKSAYDRTQLEEEDEVEIVHFIGGGDDAAPGGVDASEDTFVVAGRTFRSRLLVGTGKYRDYEENARAVEAAGAEIVTVAVRRVNVTDPDQPMLVDFIDPTKLT